MKRGEYDDYHASISDSDSGTVTVILRLYEAFGGHAKVQLNIARHLPVAKAFVTNLLEDEQQELSVARVSISDDDTNENGIGATGCSLNLSFRGFEVKTVKLVIGAPPPPPSPTKKESVISTFI